MEVIELLWKLVMEQEPVAIRLPLGVRSHVCLVAPLVVGKILHRRPGETQSIPCRWQLHALDMSPSSATNWMLSGVQRVMTIFAMENIQAGVCFPFHSSSVVAHSS